MTTAKSETATRQHEHVLDIEASPEQVWEAMTDPQQLTNWFPLRAEAEPGVSGQLIYRWDELECVCSIQAWDPPRHLQTCWLEALSSDKERGTQLAVDWYLEGAGGKTRLRLVHSGFGLGQEWDEEYDGTRRGWTFELRSLKHYLERHRGSKRSAFWIRHPVSGEAADGWSRLIGPDGFVRHSGLDDAEAGEAVKLNLASGDSIDGTTILCRPPREFACHAHNLNEGLFRVGVEDFFGQPQALVWVSLWDASDSEVAALHSRLQESLAEALA